MSGETIEPEWEDDLCEDFCGMMDDITYNGFYDRYYKEQKRKHWALTALVYVAQVLWYPIGWILSIPTRIPSLLLWEGFGALIPVLFFKVTTVPKEWGGYRRLDKLDKTNYLPLYRLKKHLMKGVNKAYLNSEEYKEELEWEKKVRNDFKESYERFKDYYERNEVK